LDVCVKAVYTVAAYKLNSYNYNKQFLKYTKSVNLVSELSVNLVSNNISIARTKLTDLIYFKD